MHQRGYAPRKAKLLEGEVSGFDSDELEDEDDSNGSVLSFSPFFHNEPGVRSSHGDAPVSAAPVYTETSFYGLSTQPFPSEVIDKLTAPLDPNNVQIKPDGTLYLPEIMYRRILNSAFGPGGWALMPRGQAVQGERYHTREWALFCQGRFISQASGESETLSEAGPATAQEGAKSQALMRCCKDIGVASELWDGTYVNDWKAKFATTAWCENLKTGQKKIRYRRQDRDGFPFPWKEISKEAADQASSSSSPSSASPKPAVAAAKASTSTPSRSSSSSKPAAAAAKASTSTPSRSSSSKPAAAKDRSKTSFDLESVLPSGLRHYKGMRWSEVLSTANGQRYIRYIATRFKESDVRNLAQRALDAHEARK